MGKSALRTLAPPVFQPPAAPARRPPPLLRQGALREGQRVLRAEAAALALQADLLAEPFVDAVELIEAVCGRVILTGIGKSGLVARKIAATFASTGTPACFVHPAEASHGDLGMITEVDAVLALSMSGESGELADTLYHARQLDLKLLAITQRPSGRLARAASIVLLLPELPEACPLGVAPMTSSTMAMALGDALAAALMLRRRFAPESFRALHPGGRLGTLLLTAAEIMHVGEAVPVVATGTSIADAILVMTSKRLGCVGVVGADGTLCGIFTDGDLRRAFADGIGARPIDAAMSPCPSRIAPDMLVVEAAKLMQARGIPSVFVTSADAIPIGIIHLHDLLRSRLV